MFQFLTKPITFDFKSNAFDFLRLFFAIVVVVYHSTLYFNGVIMPDWAYFPISGWKYNETHIGEIAVHGFFVISGFLITASMLRSATIQEFFYKRLVRLFPGFIVAIFLTAFVFAPIIGLINGQLRLDDLSNVKQLFIDSSRYFFRNMFFETPVNSIPAIHKWELNGSLWTLLVDFRTYTAIAVLWLIGWLQKPKFILVGTVIANLFYFVLTKVEWIRNDFDQIFYDFRVFSLIIYFFVGTVFYLYINKIVWNWGLFLLSVLGLVIGTVFNIGGLLFPICIAYIVLFLSQTLPIKDLSKKIGDYSYGVYIYSTPIQIILHYIIVSGVVSIGFFYYNVLSILISIFAGYLSWNLVEKRFLKRK
jgi:peptidoglycan/LPS O-acetylase OafA/YrhL